MFGEGDSVVGTISWVFVQVCMGMKWNMKIWNKKLFELQCFNLKKGMTSICETWVFSTFLWPVATCWGPDMAPWYACVANYAIAASSVAMQLFHKYWKITVLSGAFPGITSRYIFIIYIQGAYYYTSRGPQQIQTINSAAIFSILIKSAKMGYLSIYQYTVSEIQNDPFSMIPWSLAKCFFILVFASSPSH